MSIARERRLLTADDNPPPETRTVVRFEQQKLLTADVNPPSGTRTVVRLEQDIAALGRGLSSPPSI